MSYPMHAPRLSILFISLLIATHMVAQSDSLANEQRVGLDSVSDSLNAAFYSGSDSISFCGCQSTEVVMQCAESFEFSGPVLKTGYELSFVSKTIIRGSCWDFANEVYKRAGVKKETAFSSSKSKRYADADSVKPGDWIYHINYAYGNVEHSAIFVCWKDRAKKQAITLSYVGRNRAVPGRLDVADLRSITSIFRAIPD
jgi:hypothetical protein